MIKAIPPSQNARIYAGLGWAFSIGPACLLLIVNGAVGILRSEDSRANMIFLAVLATAVVGTLWARLDTKRMQIVMRTTAAAQVMVGVGALLFGLAAPGWKGLYEVSLATVLFGALWLLSAWFFGRAEASHQA
jgi:hypothetical protein